MHREGEGGEVGEGRSRSRVLSVSGERSRWEAEIERRWRRRKRRSMCLGGLGFTGNGRERMKETSRG